MHTPCYYTEAPWIDIFSFCYQWLAPYSTSCNIGLAVRNSFSLFVFISPFYKVQLSQAQYSWLTFFLQYCENLTPPSVFCWEVWNQVNCIICTFSPVALGRKISLSLILKNLIKIYLRIDLVEVRSDWWHVTFMYLDSCILFSRLQKFSVIISLDMFLNFLDVQILNPNYLDICSFHATSKFP